MNSIFHKSTFWACFVLVSACCLAYTFTFFPRAFPIVNITITMDRDQALAKAIELAHHYKWGPAEPSTAISFDSDSEAQTFIELEGGGQQAYMNMLQQHWYEPYTWHVRLLREFETNETHVYFTPDGTLYGFKEIIAEDTDLPSLKKSEALSLAKARLSDEWHIDMNLYELVEASKKIQQNNRVDRTFIFERTDITLNDGRDRLKVIITGNKMTEVKPFIKIPEAFTLKYKQMRSYNSTIASAGYVFAYIFYILIGCLVGLFVLLRIHWVVWQTPMVWALLIALLDALMVFNSLPLLWMHYKTEGSMQAFLLEVVVQALTYFFIRFTMLGLVFVTAESLTRRAFGNNIQLWKSWSLNVANSYNILGQTIGGYLLVSIDFAFLVTFYLFTTYYFSWWTPMSHIVDPNILANYFPWLSSIVMSLGAGFLEECQFRAIPLAGAALLGDQFGKKKYWLIGAFIMQALVFSAAHASYPSYPAYARLVELIIPSCIFAALYLRFGLLTSVIAHYTYDAILFALPIFAISIAQAWGNQLIVILLIFVPLLVVLYRRWQAGIWNTIAPENAYNRSWQPTQQITRTKNVQQIVLHDLNTKTYRFYLASACIGFVAWLLCTPFHADSPPLKLSKNQAIDLARSTLSTYDMTMDESYKPYVQIQPDVQYDEKISVQHTYIWQTYGSILYHALLGTYLNPPHWLVRFLRFEGSLMERSEEYEVRIGADHYDAQPDYKPLSWKHTIPEQIAGASLSKKEALEVILHTLTDHGYDVETLNAIKAKPKQLPERTDWQFTFADTKDNKLQLKVTVAGDQVNELDKKVHVPEQFKRDEQNKQTLHRTLKVLCQLCTWVLFIAGLLYALLYLAQHGMHIYATLLGFICFIALFALEIGNNWPNLIAQFNTQAPFMNQLFTTYAVLFSRYLLRSSILAAIFSCMILYRPRHRLNSSYNDIYIGIATGFIVHGAWSIISLLTPSVEPLWAYYSSMGTLLPMVGFITYYVIQFILYTVTLSLCAIGCNYFTSYGSHYMFIIPVMATLACLTITGMQSLETISYWFLSSIIVGIIITALWYVTLRFAYTGIAFAIATSFTLSIIQQMLFNVIPYVWLSGSLTIGIIFGLAYYWFIICTRQQYVSN